MLIPSYLTRLVRNRLLELLPEGQRDIASLQETLHSPQLRQAIGVFEEFQCYCDEFWIRPIGWDPETGIVYKFCEFCVYFIRWLVMLLELSLIAFLQMPIGAVVSLATQQHSQWSISYMHVELSLYF
jgi:hypothetical protein